MLAKVFASELDCSSNGALSEVVGLVVKKKELWRLSRSWRSSLAWPFAPFDECFEPGDGRATTSKMMGTLFGSSVPEVPRTVTGKEPSGTVASACTEKEGGGMYGGPTVAGVKGVTWKPVWRFGKSMDTVPAKPESGTTNTVKNAVGLGPRTTWMGPRIDSGTSKEKLGLFGGLFTVKLTEFDDTGPGF